MHCLRPITSHARLKSLFRLPSRPETELPLAIAPGCALDRDIAVETDQSLHPSGVGQRLVHTLPYRTDDPTHLSFSNIPVVFCTTRLLSNSICMCGGACTVSVQVKWTVPNNCLPMYNKQQNASQIVSLSSKTANSSLHKQCLKEPFVTFLYLLLKFKC